MTKETLAIDIDEVCFPFVENFLSYHNTRHNTELVFNDFVTYKFEDFLQITIPEVVDRVYEFIRTCDHQSIEPLEGTMDALQRLSNVFRLEVITARHPQFAHLTQDWLDTKLPGVFDGFEHIGYALIREKPRTKASVCKDIGALALIDDSIQHLEDCVEVGIGGVLFGDYPWNQAEQLPRGITRCNNWKAVADYFNV